MDAAWASGAAETRPPAFWYVIGLSAATPIERILDVGVVPIIRCDEGEQALLAAHAVVRGGLNALEVTMTVPGAIRILEKLSDEFGDRLLLGAGTVLDPETARACMLAGCEFIVTPGLHLPTIEICKRYSKAVLPGALTPTEILTAWQAGADLVKVFPCENMGGASYIKALKAPLPQVRLCPTGGVTTENVGDFLSAGADAVAVGSSLISAKRIRAGAYAEIEAATRDFLAALQTARGG